MVFDKSILSQDMKNWLYKFYHRNNNMINKFGASVININNRSDNVGYMEYTPRQLHINPSKKIFISNIIKSKFLKEFILRHELLELKYSIKFYKHNFNIKLLYIPYINVSINHMSIEVLQNEYKIIEYMESVFKGTIYETFIKLWKSVRNIEYDFDKFVLDSTLDKYYNGWLFKNSTILHYKDDEYIKKNIDIIYNKKYDNFNKCIEFCNNYEL